MAKISAIQSQVKRADRFSVFVDPVVSFRDRLGQVAGALGSSLANNSKVYYWVDGKYIFGKL